MKILKFGSSTLDSTEGILRASLIASSRKEQVSVVVSPFNGIREKLVKISSLAATKDRDFFSAYNEIEGMHLEYINSLVAEPNRTELLNKVNALLKELSNIINGIYLLGDITPKIEDRVLSFGGLLSSIIFSYLLPDFELVDVRNLIKGHRENGAIRINYPVSGRLIKFKFKTLTKSAIVAGSLASNERNETISLGRGGSDFTASILAAILNASVVEVFTNVEGFMTADPRKVSKAFAIEVLSYAEAMELSHFGAGLIYTPTIQPVYQKGIPLHIRNALNPEAKGTFIKSGPFKTEARQIKGISSIEEINLITFHGPCLVGQGSIVSRLFNVLNRSDINIILITQGSSEYSLTLAINPADAESALEELGREFETEIKLREELSLSLDKDLSVIAIVGEQMKNTPGISANLFSSLGRNGISVIATAQGSSELNISVVIRKEQLKKALNVIHEGFFLSHHREVHLYLMGMGVVGNSLLKQIDNQRKKLLSDLQIHINIIGVSNSRKMLIDQKGIDIPSIPEILEKQGERADLELFLQKMKYINLRNSIFIDCTASDKVAALYGQVLQSYVSVVTANKIACSSAYDQYTGLKQIAFDRKVKFVFETNVGAGLPVISTINDLVRSGDRIISIEAVLSGTLNFIFNVLGDKVSFSKAVRMAKEKGYSEPDPRVDLSGLDVVRKLLILSREAGYPLEREEVKLKPMLPGGYFSDTLNGFWEKLPAEDQRFHEQWSRVSAAGKKLRYVALLNKGKAEVKLVEVDSTHPAFLLDESSNIIILTTERYHQQPIIIKGYGAGGEVTAAGLFAEIIRVTHV